MYNKLKPFISESRLTPYVMKSKTLKEALELYEYNIFVSEILYTPLSFLEIILRNICNEKLRKEIGEGWYLKNHILEGDNPEKGQWAIDKIEEAKKKINKRKKEKFLQDYPITLDDIVSNLEFSFWSNLFTANYVNNIWRPYLKFVFPTYERKQLFKTLDEIRDLRNRIFHYEPIIFDQHLKIKYNNIIELICKMAGNEICDYIKKLNDSEDFIIEI